MLFNSLGSNYSFGFVLRSLFASNSDLQTLKLKSLLAKKYGGQSVLLYKGREALKLSLALAQLPKGSKVGVNGFTCFVVYQAIVEAGYKPVYLDIKDRSLNFDVEALQKNKDLKVLIIQNTLGNPVDIVGIKKFCSINKIVLIEDLAHSAGGFYPNGLEMGTVGDFTALSFSRDKIIDAVSGGALVIRNNKYTAGLNNIKYKKVPFANQLRDRFYPLLTFKIRKLYPVGLGKPLHFLLKKTKMLSEPITSGTSIDYHKLPGWHATLALFRFLRLDEELRHRRMLTGIYLQNVDSRIVSPEIGDNYKISTNIRFPIFVKDRKSLINYLKNIGIYVSDIWYDAPVAPKRLLGRTDYRGECHVSEKVSAEIVNLPTNVNISKDQAKSLADKINLWLNTR